MKTIINIFLLLLPTISFAQIHIEQPLKSKNRTSFAIVVDALTFPIGTGQEETRRDALETIAAIAEQQCVFVEKYA